MSCVEVVQHLAKHGLNAGQQIKADKDPSYGEGLVDAFNCLQPDIDRLETKVKLRQDVISVMASELNLQEDFIRMFVEALRPSVNDEANKKLDELLEAIAQ